MQCGPYKNIHVLALHDICDEPHSHKALIDVVLVAASD